MHAAPLDTCRGRSDEAAFQMFIYHRHYGMNRNTVFHGQYLNVPFLAAFNNTSVNLDGITYVKWGHIRLELLLLDFIDNVQLVLSIAGEYQ